MASFNQRVLLYLLFTILGPVSHISTSVAPDTLFLGLPEEFFHVIRLVILEVGGRSVASLVATVVLCPVDDTLPLWLDLHLNDVEWQEYS